MKHGQQEEFLQAPDYPALAKELVEDVRHMDLPGSASFGNFQSHCRDFAEAYNLDAAKLDRHPVDPDLLYSAVIDEVRRLQTTPPQRRRRSWQEKLGTGARLDPREMTPEVLLDEFKDAIRKEHYDPTGEMEKFDQAYKGGGYTVEELEAEIRNRMQVHPSDQGVFEGN